VVENSDTGNTGRTAHSRPEIKANKSGGALEVEEESESQGPLHLGKAGQLRDHTGKKRRYWLVLKQLMRSAPRFFRFLVCVGMAHGTCKRHFRSKKIAPRSWWSCSEPVSCEWGGVGERKWVDGGMISDSFSLISAGGCLLSRNR
jgi:hypothetical protein